MLSQESTCCWVLAVVAGLATGLSGMFSKVAVREGSVPYAWYVLLTGLGIVAVGALMLLITHAPMPTGNAMTNLVCSGLVTGVGILLFGVTLQTCPCALSCIMPLYILGTLVMMPIAAIVFGEPISWMNTGMASFLLMGGGYMLVR